MKSRELNIIIFVCIAALLSWIAPSYSADRDEEGKKQPYTRYWMSVTTQNMIIPGMSESMSGMGGIFGQMMGGPGFGPRRELWLQLNSPQKLPPDPHATHDIPPGQKMGKTLPLLIPETERAKPERYTREKEVPEQKFEKPKFRMLIYWGCSEEIRPGQPRVIDTEKMSPEEFGKSFSAHAPSPQYPPSPRSGWIYADWPNKESHVEVPKDSSLQSEHFVHGNYMPDIRFAVDQKHDFMPPVEFTSVQGGLADSIKFQWRGIPAATGYFATSTGYNDKNGEMIIWSSSEVPGTAFGLMDFLTPGDVQKFIKEKVVMPSSTTSCSIPKGIFKDTQGSMLQFIAYGDELNAVYPPKPKDPKEPWDIIWTVKERLKSTGMLMLGQSEQAKPFQRRSRERELKEELKDEPKEEQAPMPRESEKIPNESTDNIKKLRGIFGF